jgi:Ras-related protein Rab-6A
MTTTASHKIVLLGESGVGKTCIISQYTYGTTAPDHQPTIGIDFSAKTIKKPGEVLRLQIWDTAGQEKFHSLITSYIRQATVVLLVFDITSRESFDRLENWVKTVLDLANPVFFVLGNKDDLEAQRQVSAEDAEKFANLHGARYFETSATKAHNINEVFEAIVAIPITPVEVPQSVPVPIEKPPAPQSGACC